MTLLDAKIQSIVQMDCRLNLGEPVLVGVSGGPDSVCLLHSLQRLGIPVIAAYFNHQLRPGSADEESFVRELAASQQAAYVTGGEDVGALAGKTGTSLEAAGRDARYRFLFEQAEVFKAQAVAVGHTADDQVETILMNFLRGTGLRGLRGMTYRRRLPQFHPEIPLVRPLLYFWREDILSYRDANKLTTLEDPTNQDYAFTRNRVRHELIPFLEAYNPRLKKGIQRMAGVMAGELELVEKALDSHWVEILEEAGENGYGFRRSAWSDMPTGIQRGLLFRALRTFLPIGSDIDFETINRALTFLSIPEHNGRIMLKGGIQLIRRPTLIWVLGEGVPVAGEVWPAVTPGSVKTLKVDDELLLEGNWQISAYVVERLPESTPWRKPDPDEFQAWIDGQHCPGPFIVRARRPGDRFRPLGMDGHTQKLSDVMINEKIPAEARGTWPLVVFEGEIVWLPGHRLSHSARVRQSSQRGIHLRLVHKAEK